MSSCTLNWYPDRGFELDLDASDDEVSLRMVAVPIPADGTAELRAAPVELDRLEILFKAQVEVQGEPGQLQEARVQLADEEGATRLELSAKVEEVETGDLIPFAAKLPVDVPAEAPESGGPRPMPPDEDELDWEDETTLEQMVVNAPETTGRERSEEEQAPRAPSGGLKALLDALANLGDEAEEEVEEEEEAPMPPLPPGAVQLGATGESATGEGATGTPEQAPAPEPVGDQTFTAEQEAAGLLQLLIDRDGLELEEEHEVDELVPGVVPILARRASSEAKAKLLSSWLLEQDAVADLFLDDDELTEIIDQW